MCRIDCDGGQDRKYLFPEQLLQIRDLLLTEIVGLMNDHVLREQFFAQGLPMVLLVPLQMLRKSRNFFKLLSRRQAIRALLGQTSADLPFEASHAHHVEFVEVVGRDRDETKPFEQRMGLIARLLEHAHVEL